MVRQYFTIIFIATIFFNNKCISQNITTQRQNDSVKVVEMLNTSNYYYQNEFNLDSLYNIANRALSISKLNKLHVLTSRCYSGKAIANLHRQNLVESKIDLDSAIAYANKSKDAKQIELTQLLLSGYFAANKETDKAVETLMGVLKTAENNNNINAQASVYFRLIDIYAKENNKEKIKEYLDKLSEIIKQHPDKVDTHIQMTVFDFYMNYFEKKSIVDPKNKAIQDSLNYYYQKGLAFAKDNGLVQNLGSLHAIMAIYYINKDQFLEAEPYCRKALQFKPYLDKVSLHNIYSALTYVSFFKRKDNETVKYLDTLLHHIPITTLADSLSAYHVAYEINYALRNYEASQKYYALEKQLKDKQENLKQTKIIEELQLQYETEKKDAIIKAQELEQKEIINNARLNYLLFALAFLGLLVFVVGYYFVSKNKALAIKLDLEQTKSALFKSKLNPHFTPKSANGNGNGDKPIDKILVKSQDISELVNIKDIIRCEADGTYAKIITNTKTLLSSKNLKHFEELLTKRNFIRVHNSHLINVEYIQTFNRQVQDGLQLHNGDKIPVSARKKKVITDFLDALG